MSCCWKTTAAVPSAHRLLTRTERLPVGFRIDLKILVITFKALNGLAPCYISNRLPPYGSVCSQGDRACYMRVLRLWKDMHKDIWLAETLLYIFLSIL